MKMFDVKDKVVVVTGASSGIGASLATTLAQRGAKTIGVARRKELLLAWQAKAGGHTAIIPVDLMDKEAPLLIKEQAEQHFGAPDILVNGAGINLRQMADDVTYEGWNATLRLNLSVPFFLAQILVPGMKQKGWGRIVNFASLQSRRAFKGGISYGASKGGVEQMTRAMAEAWSPLGIMVNALAPGFFPTELTAPVFTNPEHAQKNAEQTCVGRNGQLSDLDGPLLFLCSDAAAYVTGQMIFVDGGFTAK